MAVERPRGIISARRGSPRKLEQVVSVRMDAELLTGIRAFAEAEGVSSSTWIRDAAALAALERQKPAAIPGYRLKGWQCAHVTITAGGATFGKSSCSGGCEMQPVYELVPVDAMKMPGEQGPPGPYRSEVYSDEPTRCWFG